MEKKISRREFLRKSALAGAGMTALAACGKNAQNIASPQASGEMTYRTWGEDRISLLGYGCMRWPFTKDTAGNDVIDQEKVNELVDYAIEHGVNYFDTSYHYGRGQSEKATGIALKRHPRDKWYIATKMTAFLDEFGERQREESIRHYKESFELLQVDTIDYYLIHGAGIGGMERLHKHFLDIGLLDYFLEERRQGHIRHFGFSFHGDLEVFDYLLSIHDQVHWDMVQIQMNYADWKHASGWNINAEYLYGRLFELGIPVVIMEPIRGGSLARLPEHLTTRLKALRPEDSAASWSFRFNGTYPGVMTVLSGMTYMEHLEENVRTFSPLVEVSEEDKVMLEEIATLLLEYPLVPCTACEYCMPCPYGINIPGIFQHYNKCVTEGTMATNRQDPGYRKARRAYLVSYDRAIPTLRQADHCIGCGQCMVHCPQTIKIPDELHRIDQYIEKLKQENL